MFIAGSTSMIVFLFSLVEIRCQRLNKQDGARPVNFLEARISVQMAAMSVLGFWIKVYCEKVYRRCWIRKV